MAPTRSAAPKAFKRDRSTSSSLSPAPLAPAPARNLSTTKESAPRPEPYPGDEPKGRSPKKPRVSKVKKAVKEEAKLEDADDLEKPVKASTKATKAKAAKKDVDEDEAEVDGKKKAKGKGKAWPPPDLDPASHPERAGYPVFPLPPLSVAPNGGIASSSSTPRPHLLGAHTSIGGGPATALLRASKAGANGLAMFVKSQRQWKSNPYEDIAVERFIALMRGKEEGGLGYPAEGILVHGSYLINLGNPDQAKWKTSYDCFKDDIYRCHQLGIKMYNWHPGSTVGACTREESYASIAKAINMVHKEVPEVITVIENMANAKLNIIGTTFHDLASIVALVEDKSRVRICLDTCHLFAAGYDIRTPETYAETMQKFDSEVGNGYLAGMHLNDSKAELGACKDLHENIGLGHIGLTAFRSIMRDPLMSGIPLILETPADDNPLEAGELSLWQREIKLLYEIQSISDAEWPEKKVEIEARWRAERDVLNPPKEKKAKGPKPKAVKEPKAANGKKSKATKKDEVEDEDEGCESHAESD